MWSARELINLSPCHSPSCSFHGSIIWWLSAPSMLKPVLETLWVIMLYLWVVFYFFFVSLSNISNFQRIHLINKTTVFLGGTEALRFVAVLLCPCCICPALADPCELPRGQERLQTRCEWRVLSSNGTNSVCRLLPLLPLLPNHFFRLCLLWIWKCSNVQLLR